MNCSRFVTATMVLASTTCLAQVSVNAGEDASVLVSESITLTAVVSGQSVISCIKADGNNGTEDSLIKFHSDQGLSSVGPLRDADGRTFGWPSDLIRIDGTIYGIETFHQLLYTLDEETGLVTPIGPPAGRTRLGSLAYDPAIDTFYSIDFFPSGNELISIDRQTGEATSLFTNLPFNLVKGLAYHVNSGLLYVYDQELEAIYTLNPNDGTTSFLVAPFHDRGGFFDELTFFDDGLYGPFRYVEGGIEIMQVRRIDAQTGAVTDIGPPINEISAHSLIIDSLPEKLRWSALSGPGSVTFAQADAASTSARFSEFGEYVLQFTAEGNGQTVSDVILVSVEPDPGEEIIEPEPIEKIVDPDLGEEVMELDPMEEIVAPELVDVIVESEPGEENAEPTSDATDTPIGPTSPVMCGTSIPGTGSAMLLVIFSLRLRRRRNRFRRTR